ncbi:MAG: 3'(2'),5'-bisphosphate nucleotidase CysQ [Bacteroidota bacterium]|nr:3'(2'),5'-bisphosphate nucleotidase CysQ [Bacteroidota bacterium]MDP3146937.1 3'(2'),5'-bisphosphate nucleotidase CysQ [Bacteroidota bacterium]
MNYNSLLKLAIAAALAAGNEILKIYETDFLVQTKSDNTPVTLADKKASKIIIDALSQTNIPIISEEEEIADYELRKSWTSVWLIDPLDGTKEFVKRNGEFTVNIALIENKKPIIGVIFSPVSKELFFADIDSGSFKINKGVINEEINNSQTNFIDKLLEVAIKLPVQRLPKTYTVVASRSHLSKDINQHISKLKNVFGEVDIINVGSSIKQCWVAEGRAHEYLRLGTTMEWDTAAGQCILEQAGAKLIDLETNLPMIYNKENMENSFFIAKQTT